MKIISVLFLCLLVVGFGSAISFEGWFFSSSSTVSAISDVNVTLSNFATSFKNNAIVVDLPSSAAIRLSVGKKDFFIGRGLIETFSGQNVDISVRFPKKYINRLSTKNYCQILRDAISSKDYSVSLNISRIEFMWKYRRLISYHRCFGF